MTGFDYLKNFLQEEGFRFQDEGGYISFKFKGITFVAFKSDSPYLKITVLCKALDYDKSKLLDVCNQMNMKMYVMKFVVGDRAVWCNFEFIPSEHTTKDDFVISLELLDEASNELLARLAQ